MRLPLGGHYSKISIDPLIKEFQKHNKKHSTDLIKSAFLVASKAHEKQVRRSGEPYITHPLAVALIVAKLGLDDVTLAAALLHDCVEDTDVTLEEVKENFGQEVSDIVDGVTKLDRIAFSTKEEQQIATFRKMFISMAKDVRVVIIKLADRLHNMRTIASFITEKQERIAKETIDIYAPLAHRLGMQEVKWQLEDLSFAAIYPKRYAEVENLVLQTNPQSDKILKTIFRDIKKVISYEDIYAEISARPKHYWSIYEKMVIKGKAFNEVTDLLGIRIVVDEVKDCYTALGSIHSMWRPVPGRFKDYIATPKFNLYQSLHTTVITNNGELVEIQIRTKDMHRRAEYGVAAHWGYKNSRRGVESKQSKNPKQNNSLWIQNLADSDLSDLSDPKEFMNAIKRELVDDDVYVFTPKGKVITLPVNSTPVDFAYMVHTEVGHKCIGAKVNGRIIPLSSKLTSGDSVEILTAKDDNAKPSQDWLNFVSSSKARAKIKQWFIKSRREDAIEDGEEALRDEIKRAGLPLKDALNSVNVSQVAKSLGQHSVEAMFVAIGDKHLSAKVATEKFKQLLQDSGEATKVVSIQNPPRRSKQKDNSIGIHVEGFSDMLVRVAQCCTPVPGDDIVGFITKGRGVSVHRSDCVNSVRLAQISQERLIDVEWQDSTQDSYIVSVNVEALDRPRLLQDIATSLSDNNVNIISCTSHTSVDRVSKFRFEFELSDVLHLDSIISLLKRVEGVYEVYRSNG